MGDPRTIRIDGMNTLKTINDIISQEEEVSWEFVSNKTSDSDKKNIVSLKELTPGTTPEKALKLVETDKQDGFWSGAMWVEGEKKQVAAYRIS